MKARKIATALFLGALTVVVLATEPSGTLTIRDSEHPDALVNAEDETRLQMKVIAPTILESGKKYEIRVEIHNPSAYIEIVYMPGLTLRPAFLPNKKDLHADEYGPPMVFGRMSAKDESLNFVVLMGGDSYLRTYRWTPPDAGKVVFKAVYQNNHDGTAVGVKAWTGELASQSAEIAISKESTAEQSAGAYGLQPPAQP